MKKANTSQATSSKKTNFIKKPFPKDKVYSVWLHQIDSLEKTATYSYGGDSSENFEKSMDIVFKLFPIIDSISLNLFGSLTGRKYLHVLGYSSKESNLIYTIFRNGIMHTLSPYEVKYKNATVSWGMMSSGGTGGFTPHFPGYKDHVNPQFDEPADKAFECIKFKDGTYHASLSLDTLTAQIKYDLTERQKNDTRTTIKVIVGQIIDEDIK